MALHQRIKEATEVPEVPEPAEDDTGFINDFLLETNENSDVSFIVGDKVDLRISCDGYEIDPVLLCAPKDGGDEDQFGNYFLTTVVLRPTATSYGNVVTVPESLVIPGLTSGKGLTPGEDISLSLSLHPNDPYSEFVSFNKENGEISIQVILFPYQYGDVNLPPGIYLNYEDHDVKPLESPLLQNVWNKYQMNEDPEGVLYQDSIVPPELANDLNMLINKLAKQEPIDWHPGSNDCVRDLVHPSMYPYVRGESPVVELDRQNRRKLLSLKTVQPTSRQDITRDRFGRPFESSGYQWLPAVFQVDEDGRTSIESYINNLDKDKYPDLYESLARLFEVFLPHFERVYAYLKALTFVPDEDELDDGLMDIIRDFHPDLQSALLRGKKLHVITKIVDYELRGPDDKVEGVYHVEGMSSDHIIMTGLYIAHRDSDFEGADILFQRAFLDYEASAIFETIAQGRHWKAEKIVDDGLRPLGKVDTPEGRIVVFPNCHIHKLTAMFRGRSITTEVSRRRIIVFWVVDPDCNVLTTREVPKQQETSMTLKRALEHRLMLMEERKKYKGKFNAERKISLCEH